MAQASSNPSGQERLVPVNGRISERSKQRLAAISQHAGVGQSELFRRAVDLLIATYCQREGITLGELDDV